MNKGFFHDRSGKLSHTRLLVILTVPAIVLLPLFIWAALSIAKIQMMEIPLTVTGYLGAANAIILGYSGVKSYQEKGASSPDGKAP